MAKIDFNYTLGLDGYRVMPVTDDAVDTYNRNPALQSPMCQSVFNSFRHQCKVAGYKVHKARKVSGKALAKILAELEAL